MDAKVTIYTTDQCPHCNNAKTLFRAKGWTNVDEIRVDKQPDRLAEMVQLSGRRTVPQIWIDGSHIGGFDDLLGFFNRAQSS